MFRTGRALRIAVAGLTCATVGLAHDTWLAPHVVRLDRPGRVTLSLTSGMEFPQLDHAIKSSRVAIARQRTPAGTFDIEAITEGANALQFGAEVNAAGVATLWVVLHPFASELKAEQVREYVAHLGLGDPASVIAAWEKTGEGPVKYRYTKYAKTFVRVGDSSEASRWRDATGMQLELTPEHDPTSVSAGGTIAFLLSSGGRPLPHYPVSLVGESVADAATHRTDGEGRVRLQLPGTGRYMVRATTLESSAAPDTRWDVHFTTVTIEASRHLAAKN